MILETTVKRLFFYRGQAMAIHGGSRKQFNGAAAWRVFLSLIPVCHGNLMSYGWGKTFSLTSSSAPLSPTPPPPGGRGYMFPLPRGGVDT
jgi:hypothetical protein